MENTATASPDRDTKTQQYTDRLANLESVWWKRLLDVQAPYRRNLQSLNLGITIDVGCGIGRNLGNLPRGSIGVDHNQNSISVARTRGLTAFTPSEFNSSEYAKEGRFDALLCAHTVEHMGFSDALGLLKSYLPYIKSGGKIVLITPQEAGFKSDKTHVAFVGFPEIKKLFSQLNIQEQRLYSFPFPRFVGHFFKHNECVGIGTR